MARLLDHPDLKGLRVAVIGAGVIGLTSAWQLARGGAHVHLFTGRNAAPAASAASGGMLSAFGEAVFHPAHHADLAALCSEAAGHWPDFAARLEREAGALVFFHQSRTLALAFSEADTAQLEIWQRRAPQSLTLLSRTALVRQEPSVSGAVFAGLRLEGDGDVDPKALMGALGQALGRHPRVELAEQDAELKCEHGRVQAPGFDAVLVAAGWSSAEIPVASRSGVKRLSDFEPALAALRPVSGQARLVRCRAGAPRHVLRHSSVYVVPRGETTLIGATIEPGRVRLSPDSAMLDGLQAEAARLAPVLADAETVMDLCGVRPGTPDDAPLIGRAQNDGMFLAAGHYRNGILLAPLTASWIACAIAGESLPPLASAFSPGRSMTATA